MNKKLIKSRSSHMDTLEAMVCSCNCTCYDPCANCSGGGSFFIKSLIIIMVPDPVTA